MKKKFFGFLLLALAVLLPFNANAKEVSENLTLSEDVTDGIIYYKPCYEMVLTIGIPGIVSADFEEEFMRRIKIYFEAMDRAVPTLEEAKPAYDRFVSFPDTYPQNPDSVKNFIRSLMVKYYR